ncbi:MAG TPA: hypothetical protein VGQ00_04115 [Candidatus Norongarragalinales archaeon]|nr:hypothetical protein [Candidatus Norongarragalinales archaeon]
MGRTKGVHIHSTAKALVKKAPQIFGTTFDKNKDSLRKLGLLKEGKEERNKLAGEVTVLMKKRQREIEAEAARG